MNGYFRLKIFRRYLRSIRKLRGCQIGQNYHHMAGPSKPKNDHDKLGGRLNFSSIFFRISPFFVKQIRLDSTTAAASNKKSQSSSTTSQPIRKPTVTAGAGVAVFDRETKRMQRNRAAANFQEFDYLRAEVAYRVADRIYDIKKFFDVAVDFGCGTGLIAPHIFKENVGTLIQIEMSEEMLKIAKRSDEVPTFKILADEEMQILKPQSIDLAVCCLSLHWINDLPAFFRRVHECLRPDGVLVGAMFGGHTLYQLRCALQLAELERLGGLSAHISPFTEVRDVGSLMNRAGFKMLTVDIDSMEVKYSSIYRLMYDLQGMAENSCSWLRAKTLRRDVMDAASAIYTEMYADQDGQLPATFQVIYLIGWREGPSTPKPAKRGSASVSMKDIEKVVSSGTGTGTGSSASS